MHVRRAVKLYKAGRGCWGVGDAILLGSQRLPEKTLEKTASEQPLEGRKGVSQVGSQVQTAAAAKALR